MRRNGFTVVELLVVSAIIIILAGLGAPAVWGAYKASSLAVSANNIRQLAAGSAAYLGDHNYSYWPYRASGTVGGRSGTIWWFGFESSKSMSMPEGQRTISMDDGPLGPYLPRNMVPDPSFGFTGKPFKPKYEHGYIGVGYNVLLAGTNGWVASGGKPMRYWELTDPSQTVVFATSAQVNSFQKPATPKNPMIEEFYGFDDDTAKIPSVHFRHNGHAMVAYANGSAGLIPIDPATSDKRAPEANVGRLDSKCVR